jgi:hypothetical protein
MSDARVRELWVRLQGAESLTPAEDRELVDALRSPSPLRDELLKDAELEGLLHNLRRTPDEESAFEDRVVASVEAERDASGFVRRVESRIPSRPRHRRGSAATRSSSTWVRIAAFAAAFLVAVLAGTFRTPTPTPTPASPARRVVRSSPPAIRENTPEKRLVELDRRRREAEAEVQAAADAKERNRLEKAEAEVRAVAEAYRKVQEDLARDPGQAPPRPPSPPAPPPVAEVPGFTRTALAAVERLDGEALAIGTDGRTPLRPGDGLLAGQEVECAGPLLVLRYPDGTRVDLETGSLLKLVDERRAELRRGRLSARVAPRPGETPRIFPTPHAEAVVLGTTLRLAVEPGSTRLEVEAGRVRLKRLSDGRSVDVAAGQFAVAGPKGAFRAERLPVRDVLLTVKSAVLSGADWQVVRDAQAVGGLALEALRTPSRSPANPAPASKVVFRFQAEADLDYAVWMRGKLEPGRDSGNDAVILEFPGATVRVPPVPAQALTGGPSRAFMNGWCHRPGWWWVGGDADGEENRTPMDSAPAVVRFSGSGPRSAVLYAYESPVRIDAIWLSAGQWTRPADGTQGPGAR